MSKRTATSKADPSVDVTTAGEPSTGVNTAPASSFGQGQLIKPPPPLDGRLADLLAGKKIVLTGVTGFIGEQILWKILTNLPDTKVSVLIRRKGSMSAEQRAVSLVRKPIFADLRTAAGGPEELVSQRIEVLEGDLPHVPALPTDLDVVIHCAGDVSFDPPIDAAFRTNVVGTEALLNAVIAACSDDQGNLIRVPHYLHVSTAYTAGRRRGAIPEAAHPHDVDPRLETAAAQDMAEHVERQSRSASQLEALRRQAERLHRQAGFLTTAEDTERRRQEWVKSELVSAGTERARSLGWTDVYTFAKAMGERIVEEYADRLRISIVRPAIVESSLVHPYPGWIEGYKMADPLILAYAHNEIPEFPGSPDGVIDIVPCDHVVNATLAVAATLPEVGDPQYYHSSSGARNPLTFRGIYECILTYFVANRWPDENGNPYPLATWTFPGPAKVERMLSLAEFATATGERLVTWAPRSNRVRAAAIKLDKQVRQLSALRRYLSLYGEYLQTELHFVDDRTLALHRSLHPDDVETFAFDTAAVNWRYYLNEVHVPAITDPVRRLEAARQRRAARSTTYRELRPSDKPILAAFDLDGTVMATNVIETYLWARLPEMSPLARVGEVAKVLGSLPGYLSLNHRDRGMFLRSVYRRYQGMTLDELNEVVDTRLADFFNERISPEAVARIQEHRAVGHTTVLITGVIRPFTRPIAHLFDVIVAADLATDANGVCSGFLSGPPMVGESRSAWLRHYADLHGIDLSASFAYADSHVDLPMLRAVGNPVAVSPDVGLLRAARQGSWSILDWPATARHRSAADLGASTEPPGSRS